MNLFFAGLVQLFERSPHFHGAENCYSQYQFRYPQESDNIDKFSAVCRV